MNDHDNRIAALEAQIATLILRDERRESEHRNLLKTYDEVKADRETLRQDLDLNVTFLTDRLESLKKARTAGGTDTELVEDIAVIYEGLLSLLKYQSADAEHLHWLTGIVTRNMERESARLGIVV
jgi:hypothetical protein